MKKQNFIPTGCMLVLLALVVTLSTYNHSYAFTLSQGTVCFQHTITDDTFDTSNVGKTFIAHRTYFSVFGSNAAVSAWATYPGTTAPAYFAGTAQVIDNIVHIEDAVSLDMAPVGRFAGVLSLTFQCNSKGQDCTGTWFQTLTGVDLENGDQIGIFYQAGTSKQIACPE